MRIDVNRADVRARLLLFWAFVVPAALLQGALESALRSGGLDGAWLLRWRGGPVLAWVLATPLFVLAARRWPVRPPHGLRHAALHVAIAGAWALVSNVLFRVPELIAGVDPGLVLRDALEAAVAFAPAILLVYAALVALVQLRSPEDVSDAPRSDAGRDAPRHLPLRVDGRIRVVPVCDVRWVEADGDHVRVHTTGSTHRVRGRLAEFERRLDDSDFVRVHRSALVRSSEVRELRPLQHGDYAAVLGDGAEVRVARTRRAALDRLLGRADSADA